MNLMTDPGDNAWGHPARHYVTTSVAAERAAARADEEASGRWAEALEHAFAEAIGRHRFGIRGRRG